MVLVHGGIIIAVLDRTPDGTWAMTPVGDRYAEHYTAGLAEWLLEVLG